MTDPAMELRDELERLSYLLTDLTVQARRLIEEGECWLATDDHTFALSAALGSGQQVAVKYFLIDPTCVPLVPEEKRLRVSAQGLALRMDRLEREAQELLAGPPVGEGWLLDYWSQFATALQKARGVMQTI